MWNYLKLAVLGLLVVLLGLAANYGRDFAYQVHALIFMAAAAMTIHLHPAHHRGRKTRAGGIS